MPFFLALYRKELKILFLSWTVYIFLGLFLFFSGWFYYQGMLGYAAFSLQPASAKVINLQQNLFQPLYSNLVFLLVLFLPILTMRSIADERRQGTYQLLITYPGSPMALIGAKYVSVATIFLTALSLTFVYPLVTLIWARVEWPLLGATFLGALLCGSAILAIGLFFSTVSGHFLVAALLTETATLFFWLMGWIAEYLPQSLSRVIYNISFYHRLRPFLLGVIDTDDTLYFLNLACFFLLFSYFLIYREQRA